MASWTFKQLSPFSESASWQTDVLRSPNGEQRVARRAEPFISYTSSARFDPGQYATAQVLIEANDILSVPNWARVCYPGLVAAGSNVLLTVDTTDTDLEAGATAMLWGSWDSNELVTVTSVTASSVELASVIGSYSAPRLMPVFQAVARGGLDATRAAANNISANCQFYVLTAPTVSSVAYPQYRSLDVLADKPIVGGGSFSESLRWDYSAVGGDSNRAKFYRTRDLPERGKQMRWHAITRAEIQSLRQFVYSRKGQQKAFWYSTRNADFNLVSNVGSSDTDITVTELSGVTTFAVPFDIEIVSNGISYYRQVISVTSGPGVFTLELDSSLGVNVQSSGARVSNLHCVRFSRDSVEFNYSAAEGCTVEVSLIECPVP